MLRISDKGVRLLKNLEGLRLKMYADADGNLTIGYGHLVKASDVTLYRNGITLLQAETILLGDIRNILAAVGILEGRLLEGKCLDAVIIFIFNVGVNAFLHSTMLQGILAGNLKDVPKQFDRWVHGRHGVVIPGLVNRQKTTRQLFEEGLKEIKS